MKTLLLIVLSVLALVLIVGILPYRIVKIDRLEKIESSSASSSNSSEAAKQKARFAQQDSAESRLHRAAVAEAKGEALRLYPALGEKGSQFNVIFTSIYNSAKKNDPGVFDSPTWPLGMAKQAASYLEGKPKAVKADIGGKGERAQQSARSNIETTKAVAKPDEDIVEKPEASKPVVPHVTATSLQRGNMVQRSSSMRIAGDAKHFFSSQSTTRIVAVKVQLRSFSKPTNPYEVQCFFTAKNDKKTRYVYDCVKVRSFDQFDEISIYGKDLFGGSKEVERTVAPVADRNGFYYPGSIGETTVTDTKTGSKLEGWIVRVISNGVIVRSVASLQELQVYAEEFASDLDGIATQTAFSR